MENRRGPRTETWGTPVELVKIKTDDWADALASLSDSDTDRTAVSVECPCSKPDCRRSRRLLLVRKVLGLHTSLKDLGKKWKK